MKTKKFPLPLSDTNKKYIERIRADSIEHRKKLEPIVRPGLGDIHGRKELTNGPDFDPSNPKNSEYWNKKKLINQIYNEKREVNDLIKTKDDIFGAELDINDVLTDKIFTI
jgi:hypothetical protein